MNKNDKKQVSNWLDQLDEVRSHIEDMIDTEQEKYDNLPEGIQDSERGGAIEEAIENLEAAKDSLEEAIESLEYLTD